ncbi:DUF2255 family protein [Novosphingobium beihaiensis]|uniref:DUF2255 family protein n=1 Tax=Novosphingobium beihaiensis TaxID=2930389 RepID=A0ABT0BRY2_9SPHN|nr:DUF2255 family protein [Novosphingobium beihaiensis]MCJ2187638.1 DUF2255 family protein [Novosphingobium beihaiensis]
MWTPQQLEQFAAADDCRIAPFREDGATPGTPTFIWSVVTPDGLFVRAYSGRGSSWFQAALKQKAGQIHLAGQVHDVSFEPVSDDANDAIDAAYRAKYGASRYLGSMISPRARAATVRVLPRNA